MKRYSVHRAIVCSRSEFFENAIRNPFRESQTGVIDLTEDDPEAVEHMVNCELQPLTVDSQGLANRSLRLLPSRLSQQGAITPLVKAGFTTSITTLFQPQTQEIEPRPGGGPARCNGICSHVHEHSPDAASRRRTTRT